MKRFHSDNGGAYMSLEKCLQKEGIAHMFSAACSPESNGVAEICNRTLLGKMRSLLYESKLEQRLWREGTLYSVYLFNATSHKSFNGSTLFEMIFKRCRAPGNLLSSDVRRTFMCLKKHGRRCLEVDPRREY